VERARQCLALTTPSIRLQYPADAEEHFDEIHRVMARWLQMQRFSTANYKGKRIEDAWVERMRQLHKNRPAGQKLIDIFGPWIPLVVPWFSQWQKNHRTYPEGLVNTLLSVLRPDVPYLTVSQNDDGLTGKCEFLNSWVPNLLVLSAGGNGHVAVPLFNQPEPVSNEKPMAARKYFMTFVGSLTETHPPYKLRERLAQMMKNEALKLGFKTFCGKAENWRQIMADTRVSLCPRGNGRSSYHLVETLQSGLIPVHIYSDTPWVPYPDLFEKLGYVVSLGQLPALVARLHGADSEELAARERAVLQHRDSHFSLAGALGHIEAFMLHGGGDLRCRPLPDNKTDNRQKQDKDCGTKEKPRERPMPWPKRP